jgi:F-type H+-transporting ATPase subunit delta
MAELTTIARPYAQAVFKLAQESGTLSEWADMLRLLSAVVQDAEIKDLLRGQRLEKDKLISLLQSVCERYLIVEAKNLVALLGENRKLSLLPEIQCQYDVLKGAQEGYVTVDVVSTYAVKTQQKQQIVEALKTRLGKEVQVNTTIDRSLLGGWLIRYGDKVLDLSIRGRLQQMTVELYR